MTTPLRASLTYGLGSLLSRVVSFVMQPVYTHYIVPAEYGKYSLVILTTEIVGIAVSAGTTAGFLRFYYKAEGRRRHEVAFSALVLNAGLNLLGSVFLIAFAVPLGRLVLSSPADAVLFRILGGSFLLEAFIAVPLIFLQAQQRPGLVVVATVVRTVISALLNLWFLAGLGLGVRGMALSGLIAATLLATVLTTSLLRQTGFAWSGEVARSLRRFGIPYQFAMASAFILAFGDRYVLKLYRPLEEVGLYGFAYQFGFLLHSLTASPFLSMWVPLQHEALELPRVERDVLYNRGLFYMSITMILGAVALSLIIKPLLVVLTAPSYHSAARYVPIILAAYVVQGWAELLQFGIDVSERTRYATVAFWGAALATILLYFLLIPPFGGWGAAGATLLGFCVRLGLIYRFAHRLVPISYDWPRILAATGLGIACVLAGLAFDPDSFGYMVLVACLLGGGFLVSGWFLILRPVNRIEVRDVALRGLQRLRLVRSGSVS